MPLLPAEAGAFRRWRRKAELQVAWRPSVFSTCASWTTSWCWRRPGGDCAGPCGWSTRRWHISGWKSTRTRPSSVASRAASIFSDTTSHPPGSPWPGRQFYAPSSVWPGFMSKSAADTLCCLGRTSDDGPGGCAVVWGAYACARLFRIQPKPKRPPIADRRNHAAAGKGTTPATPVQPPGVAHENDEGEKVAPKKGLSDRMLPGSRKATPVVVVNFRPGANRPPDASTPNH